MLQILFEDEHFIAVDKPAGLLTHRSSLSVERESCLSILRDQVGHWVYPIHRLDRATSGVLLFARDPESTEALSAAYRSRDVHKSYEAIVRGWVEESGVIDKPLAKEPGKPCLEAVSRYFRLATTEVNHAVGRYATARYSSVRVEIDTGRLHQIRRHCASISHPVIGDTVYGDGRHNKCFRELFGVHRLLLASRELKFNHPFTKRFVQICAPLPEDFVRLYEQLVWKRTAIINNT